MQAVQKERHHQVLLTVQIQYSVQSHLLVAVEVVEETQVEQVKQAAQAEAVQTVLVQVVQVILHQFLHHKVKVAVTVLLLQAAEVAVLSAAEQVVAARSPSTAEAEAEEEEEEAWTTRCPRRTARHQRLRWRQPPSRHTKQ